MTTNNVKSLSSIADAIPIWSSLTQDQQRKLLGTAREQRFLKGTVVHEGGLECTGLLVVRTGQLRAFITSADGREISLYRLLERDICLFSAACMIRSIRFNISIEAENDTDLWIVPAEIYQEVMKKSVQLANFTNELMAERMSDVMWLMEQILWESMDRRLAEYLLEQSSLQGTTQITTTHEQIARDLGTAREVVTRMLKYFKSEGLIALSRGKIEILDERALDAR
ncbi:MAG: Crp/Fnr family transcriptional regulator [Oscillospiraceae bacterium]|nr:Crp/Fnr family transcriptional regulator [Oscillospiraceae bacterium]